MRTTQNYGANGTKYDEQGRCMPPKEVWSKYEHFGDYARSASRHFNEAQFKGLCAEFIEKHGTKPTKAYAVAKCAGMRSIAFVVPGHGVVGLDIIGGQDRDFVE